MFFYYFEIFKIYFIKYLNCGCFGGGDGFRSLCELIYLNFIGFYEEILLCRYDYLYIIDDEGKVY